MIEGWVPTIVIAFLFDLDNDYRKTEGPLDILEVRDVARFGPLAEFSKEG